MRIQNLISTMNIDSTGDVKILLDNMNLNNSGVLINQCTDCNNLINGTIENYKVLSFHEKGLSKSRNRALINASADVCLLSDDDLHYENGFESTLIEAYDKYGDADIIAFYVENAKRIHSLKEGRVNFIHSFKICSVQITYKLKSIRDNNIHFDENFGAGSGAFIHGEENIFLADCIKKGLKVYYYPHKIAYLNKSESTWFKGYNKDYLISSGAQFYRMSRFCYILLILQFAFRKHKKYRNEMNFFSAIRFMFNGANKEKRIIKGDKYV